MEQGNNDASKEAKRTKGKRTTGETLNSTCDMQTASQMCLRISG